MCSTVGANVLFGPERDIVRRATSKSIGALIEQYVVQILSVWCVRSEGTSSAKDSAHEEFRSSIRVASSRPLTVSNGGCAQ